MTEESCGSGCWTIKNWNARHKSIVAAEASCLVEVGNPKLGLRFFLRPKEKLMTVLPNAYPVLTKWYSLCAEVITNEVYGNAAIEVIANIFGDNNILRTKGNKNIGEIERFSVKY